MNITRHSYTPADFGPISDFLIANFQPGNRDGNWLQPAWEYMHTHPYLDESSLHKIGVWKSREEIVGVVHYEDRLGDAFFQVHPAHTQLKPTMLAYAESHLYGEKEDGTRYVRAYVNDFDHDFEALVKSRGYQPAEQQNRPMSEFVIPRPFPPIELPAGFQLKSLADDNDLHKINRVLWRGFNHPGEPPEDGIEDRKKMQSGPNFRHDLTIVVEAPTGEFVSFCGMWYVPANGYAYVEPVATDPDFRRMGLGKAAVLEGIRRCGALGARVAYVWTDKPFYKAIGFIKQFVCRCWIKYL